MKHLSNHLKAMQAAGAASIITAALLAVPLFAANDTSETTGLSAHYYADHIVRLFGKTGAEVPGAFANESIETSAFDFAAYMSHTCFRPTDNDLASCKEEFGPYADLKSTYNSGSLRAILTQVPYLLATAHLAPAPVLTIRIENESSSKTFITPEEQTREESKKLWNACQIKEASRSAAARCYQRNIRRTQEWNRGVEEGNVY